MNTMMWIMLLCGFPVLWLMVVVFAAAAKVKKGRAMGLRIPEGEEENHDLGIVLKRCRHALLWCGGLLSLLVVPMFWISRGSVLFFFWMTWLMAALLIPVLIYGHYCHCLKKLKSAKGWAFDAEECHWFWGILYHNKENPHVLVPSPDGSGSGSFNMARFPGKVIMILVTLCVLTLPLWGVWIMVEDFTDMEVTVSETSVTATHLNSDYTVFFEDVTGIALLRELPQSSRNSGYELEHLTKGDFTVAGYGKSYLCADNRDAVILALETEERAYLISFDTEAEALAVIDRIDLK